MALKKHRTVPPPPRSNTSDAAKAGYYEKHDPVDLIDAGYFQEEGIFEGDKCVVDLRAERGLIAIPVDARIARRLHRLARRSKCTPSDLASRCLAQSLRTGSHR
jgi:hypothetical protein